MIRLWLMTAAGLLIGATPAPPVLLTPTTLLAGDRPGIAVEGLRRGEQVTVESYRRASSFVKVAGKWETQQLLFRATARFAADRRGRVALDNAVPIEGSWRGADPRGLLWSGRVLAKAPIEMPELDTLKPGEVRVLARAAGRPVVERQFRLVSARDVVVERIDTPDLVGVFAAPRGAARRPTVVYLHGSEGGDWQGATRQASLYASHGYATLSLIYFAWPYQKIANAPPAFLDLPVERLQIARDWLAARPEANVERLGVVGASKGSEFALLGASRYSWLRAIVACVPSSVVWGGFGGATRGPGFTVGGQATYIPYGDYGPVERGEITSTERHLRDWAAADAATVAGATIPVNRGPDHLLLLSGGRDAVWQSQPMSADIAARRRQAARPVEWIDTPDAGHFICGTGDSPVFGPDGKDFSQGGGLASATAAAAGRGWEATLRFLDRHLR